MYIILSIIEKIFRYLRIVFKLAYYKIKYGKRLKVGRGVHFRKSFTINIAKNGKVEIGDRTFFNNYCAIHCHNKIKIGKDNLFGENVKIYDHNHVFNDKSKDIKKTYKDDAVTIGDGNWFGSDTVILSKTSVGDSNVIGAGMVINSKFDSNLLIKNENKLAVEKIKYK